MIVYKATNTVNRKVYIGKTVRSLSHAKARHHQRAKFIWKYGVFSRFYSAMRKHGLDAFEWEIIYSGNSDADIQEAERRLISEYRATDPEVGYNMTPGGDGGAGKKLSASQIAQLKDRFSGSGNPMAGRFGNNHPAHGHQKTEEQKRRISLAHKGKKLSDEQRKVLSAARKRLFTSPEKLAEKAAREEAKQAEREARKVALQAKKAAGSFKGENAGPSKISNADRVEICRRRAAGEAYSSIAKDYRIVLTGVRAVVKDWGPPNGFPFKSLTAMRRTKLTDEQKADACKRFAAGESYQALAQEFGIGETTMFEIMRQWGPKNGFPYTGRSPQPLPLQETKSQSNASSGTHQRDLFD